MALNRPALVDALTDAGLEAEAVRRAVDVLEQDYADTAKQAEMHLRFSALEKNLADHDRLNEAQAAGAETRFKSIGDRLQDFREEVEHRFADLKENMDRGFAAVRGEIASLRNEMTSGFAAVRNEMTSGFAAVRNEMTSEFAAVRSEIASLRNEMTTEFAAVRNEMRNEFAAVRSEMTSEFAAVRNEMRNEFAAVRSEIASLRNELNGKITMLQWMIGVLFVMNGTTMGIVIAKLL